MYSNNDPQLNALATHVRDAVVDVLHQRADWRARDVYHAAQLCYLVIDVVGSSLDDRRADARIDAESIAELLKKYIGAAP